MKFVNVEMEMMQMTQEEHDALHKQWIESYHTHKKVFALEYLVLGFEIDEDENSPSGICLLRNNRPEWLFIEIED